MKELKYVFFGGKEIGSYCLNELIENNIIPRFIINFDNLIEPAVLEKADNLNIDIVNISKFKVNERYIIDEMKKQDVDTIISVAFPFIMPESIFNIVQNPINVHPAALPKYRGYHPLSEAFRRDDKYQGTTVHFMSEIVDEGDILLQDFIEVRNEDNMVTVKERLIKLSSKLLIKVVRQVQTNTTSPRKQFGEAIEAPRRRPEDSKLHFNKTSREVHNFVRALVSPYPNAFSFINGEKVNIKASITSNIVGTILDKTVNGLYVVSTSDGVVLLEIDCELEIGDVIT